MKIKNIIFLSVLGASSPFLLCGCFATQDDVKVLKTQVAALNKTLESLQKNQAGLDTQMEELMEQLVKSSENLKDFDYKLDGISVKLDNITSALEKKDGQYQMPPGEVYIQAKSQLEAKQYTSAAKGFALYIQTAPEGQNIEEAYLSLSQALYELEEYQKAAVASATLLDKYPKSKYTAAARILYARSIIPLGKKDEAKNYLQSVVQDYKGSSEAAEAKTLIGEIK